MSMSMTVTMASMVDISTRNTCTRAASTGIPSASERTFLAKGEVDACNPFQKNLQTLQPSHQQLQCRAMLQFSFEAIALATPWATSQCMVRSAIEGNTCCHGNHDGHKDAPLKADLPPPLESNLASYHVVHNNTQSLLIPSSCQSRAASTCGRYLEPASM